MTKEEEVAFAYIGIKPCGCVVAATIDSPENTGLADDVKEFIKSGYRLEHVTVEEARNRLHKCIHK